LFKPLLGESVDSQIRAYPDYETAEQWLKQQGNTSQEKTACLLRNLQFLDPFPEHDEVELAGVDVNAVGSCPK
jgi:hypothetical protein